MKLCGGGYYLSLLSLSKGPAYSSTYGGSTYNHTMALYMSLRTALRAALHTALCTALRTTLQLCVAVIIIIRIYRCLCNGFMGLTKLCTEPHVEPSYVEPLYVEPLYVETYIEPLYNHT